MTKKLFISKNSPAELKEIIRISQKYMDNIVEVKIKANNGTLTLDDLRELKRRNNLITDQFPKADPSATGFPPVNSPGDLDAIAKARAKETADLLKKEGGPAYKIDSFDQLLQLSKMPPAAVGNMILAEVAAKKSKKRELEIQTAFETKDQKQKKKFENELMTDVFDEMTRLLHCVKLMYYDLHDSWKKAEHFEVSMLSYLIVFKGFGVEGQEQLLNILHQDEKDENLAEKTLESALFLISLDSGDCSQLGDLLTIWDKNDDLELNIVRALKYSKNPVLNGCLEEKLNDVSPKIKANLIKILEYRKTINEEMWNVLLEEGELTTVEKILRSYTNNNIIFEKNRLKSLIVDPESENYENALFTCLISGNRNALDLSRKFLGETPDSVNQLPLYLTCSGGWQDTVLLRDCLKRENMKLAAIQACGILGTTEAISLLIKEFPATLSSREDWYLCVAINDSLEVITGANIPVEFPEVEEGPEGKEYEITVHAQFTKQWQKWWYQYHEEFQDQTRYRRGMPFTLGSCIEEMDYSKGNYWSRQYSYHELQIRSGQNIAPFFADWDVKDQLTAIETWKIWWEENQQLYNSSQWLFAGK